MLACNLKNQNMMALNIGCCPFHGTENKTSSVITYKTLTLTPLMQCMTSSEFRGQLTLKNNKK